MRNWFNFMLGNDEMERISEVIREGSESRLTDTEFIQNEVAIFLGSERRREMQTGIKYYEGAHDILKAKRQAIGEGGELVDINNLPNNKIIDNQYRKAVTQKTNYLLGQPVIVKSDNKQFAKHLKNFFSKRFQRLIKNVGKDSLNCGVGWLYINYDNNGELSLRRFNPLQILPLWADEEHTDLDAIIRIFEVLDYEGKVEKIYQKIEVYTPEGVFFFTEKDGGLKPDEPGYAPYFFVVGSDGSAKARNWEKIPIIPFRRNTEEIPLIRHIKSLQDGINKMLSTFENNLEEDSRSTILVIRNHDGTDLGEFRRNLAQFGAIKVKDGVTGEQGGIEKLEIEVNADNYKAIVEIFKKALIENAMAYDAKDDRIGSNANQLNIMSMYNDIDLDANEMETEFQASFEDLIWFFKAYLSHIGAGDFTDADTDVIFNRDMLMNESEIIQTINSDMSISEKTKLENHPWIDNVEKEEKRLAEERAANSRKDDIYEGAFNNSRIGVISEEDTGGKTDNTNDRAQG